MPSIARTYALDVTRLGAVERFVVEALRAGDPERRVAGAIIDGLSPLAAFGRAMESRQFPKYDMAAAMAPYEDHSLFLYTVDLDLGHIVHVKRIVRARSEAEVEATGLTGIEVIDDRLTATDERERIGLEEIRRYHGIVDIARCWNLATNFTTGVAASTRERPYTLLSYKAILEHGLSTGVEHLFAYVNPGAQRSLGRIGVPSDLLAGREFHLPADSGYDLEYVAVHLSATEETLRAFTSVDPAHPLTKLVAAVSLPVVVILEEPEGVLDLTAEDGEVVIDLTDGATEDLER
jgi:hypothetical protein